MTLSLNNNWLKAFTEPPVAIRFRVSITVEGYSGSITAVNNTGGKADYQSAGHGLSALDYIRIDGTGVDEYDTDLSQFPYYNELRHALVYVAAAGVNNFRTQQTYISNATGTWRKLRTYSFLSGKCSQITDEPECVVSVSPIKRSFDPIQKTMQVEHLSVVLNRDPLTDSLVTTHGLGGHDIVVEIGAEGLASSDFEPYFTGTIEAPPVIDGNTIKLTCKTSEARLWDSKVTLYPYNQHPIEIMETISDASSLRYDDSDFDWDVDTTKSHFVLSRIGVRNFYEDRNLEDASAAELLSTLLQVVPGALITDEDGKLRFRYFDASTADDHWTEDDYTGFRVVDPGSHLYPKVVVNTHSFWGRVVSAPEEFRASFNQAYYALDKDAARRYAVIRPADNIWEDKARTLTIDAHWISGNARLAGAMTAGSPASETSPGAGDGGTFTVAEDEFWSICGTNWPDDSNYPTGSQDANAQLSSTRTAYLRIENEIIECDQLTLGSGGAAIQIDNIRDQTVTLKTLPSYGTFRVKNRGALGTTAAAHTGGAVNEVRDVTLAVAAAQHYLSRCANGMFILEVRTSFAKYEHQISDIITLDNDEFLHYGISGLDSDTKLEIVGKRAVGLESGTPEIVWTLAYAGQTSPPSTDVETGVTGGTGSRGPGQTLPSYNSGGTGTRAIPTSGFGFTDNGGLSGTIESGTYDFLGGRQTLSANVTRTFAASSDTYVGFDVATAQLLFYETSVGGSAPPWNAYSQPTCWKITTDGSDITATEDLRGTDILADQVVTNPSIADRAITYEEVEDDTLGFTNIDTGLDLGSLLVNGTFSQRRRG